MSESGIARKCRDLTVYVTGDKYRSVSDENSSLSSSQIYEIISALEIEPHLKCRVLGSRSTSASALPYALLAPA